MKAAAGAEGDEIARDAADAEAPISSARPSPELRYFIERGSGPPLLLVHGLMVTGQMFEPVIGQLAARHGSSSRTCAATERVTADPDLASIIEVEICPGLTWLRPDQLHLRQPLDQTGNLQPLLHAAELVKTAADPLILAWLAPQRQAGRTPPPPGRR